MRDETTLSPPVMDAAWAQRLRRLVVGMLLFPVLFPLAVVVGVALYIHLVPAQSAVVDLAPARATVTLRFYWIWDVARSDGRHLSVSRNGTSIGFEPCGYDWAHWGRTGIYVTEADDLAILGPGRCDYLVPKDGGPATRIHKVSSQDWVYLGAFDLVGTPRGIGKRRLRFMSAAEQDECIEMMTRDFDVSAGTPRAEARKSYCPAFQPPAEEG